jgi:parallel beta-helix repeat protein
VDNEIAYNNTAGYNWTWEGGATKWLYTHGAIVRDNHVHHNYGMGVWFDWGSTAALIESNVTEDNFGSGIEIEAVQGTTVRDNTVRRNGHMHPVKNAVYGPGIFIANSPDTVVHNNIVEDNQSGITAHQDTRLGRTCNTFDREIRRLRVHNNVIRQPSGIAGGLQRLNVSDTSYQNAQGNRWFNNQYRLGTNARFRWINPDVQTWEQWRTSGQDESSIRSLQN